MAQQLRLKDGRIVEYLVSGTDDGVSIVWLHGTPGSYIIDPTLKVAIKNKGVKIITLSRAGYGGSSRKRGRSVIDAVADIQAVLEHLGIERCLVGGYSGGGELIFFRLKMSN
jgi:pimeloyl-ACP methyl ester carboxylesterase